MESAKRVLVYLTKESSLLQRAKFVQVNGGRGLRCSNRTMVMDDASLWIFFQGITGYFASGNPDRAVVNCGLDHNRFIISDQPFAGSRKVELRRPSFCPIKNLSTDQAASLPEEITGRGVDVGVAIVLQSVNKRILLTRRSKELHIFPNVWVPPGGHMEDGEELLDAGLRELHEETGINLRGANLPWSILGLWESTFPPLLSRGLPRRHHIVTYLLVTSNETHQELQEKLQPDEQEVSACVWLDPEISERIVASMEGEEDSGRKSPEMHTTITISEVTGRSLTQKDLSLSTLLNTAPIDGEDEERVSTGTKYALEMWLETLRREKSLKHPPPSNTGLYSTFYDKDSAPGGPS